MAMMNQQEQVDINLSSSEDDDEQNDTVNQEPDRPNVMHGGQANNMPMAGQSAQKKKNPFESDNQNQNSNRRPMDKPNKNGDPLQKLSVNNQMSSGQNPQSVMQQPVRSSLFDAQEGNIDDSEFPEEMFSIVSGIQAPKINDVQKPNVANVDQANLN